MQTRSTAVKQTLTEFGHHIQAKLAHVGTAVFTESLQAATQPLGYFQHRICR